MKILENITKDKVTTTIGSILIGLAFLNLLGYIHFPGQSWCTPKQQFMITAAGGLIFCFVDYQTIKDTINRIFKKKADGL